MPPKPSGPVAPPVAIPGRFRRRIRWLARHKRLALTAVLLAALGGWLCWDYSTLGARHPSPMSAAEFARRPKRDVAHAAAAARAANLVLAPTDARPHPGLPEADPELGAVLADFHDHLDRRGWYARLDDPAAAAAELIDFADDRAARFAATAREFYTELAPKGADGRPARYQLSELTAVIDRLEQKGKLTAAAHLPPADFRRFIDDAHRAGGRVQRALEVYAGFHGLVRESLEPGVAEFGGEMKAWHDKRPASDPRRPRDLVRVWAALLELAAFTDTLGNPENRSLAGLIGWKSRMRTPFLGPKFYRPKPKDRRAIAARLGQWHAHTGRLLRWAEHDRQVVIKVGGHTLLGRLKSSAGDVSDDGRVAEYLRDAGLLAAGGSVPRRPINLPAAESEPLSHALGNQVELTGTGCSFALPATGLAFEAEAVPTVALDAPTPLTVEDPAALIRFLAEGEGPAFPWHALPSDALAASLAPQAALAVRWGDRSVAVPLKTGIKIVPDMLDAGTEDIAATAFPLSEGRLLVKEGAAVRTVAPLRADLTGADLGAWRAGLKELVVSAANGLRPGAELTVRDVVLFETAEFMIPPAQRGEPAGRGRVASGRASFSAGVGGEAAVRAAKEALQKRANELGAALTDQLEPGTLGRLDRGEDAAAVLGKVLAAVPERERPQLAARVIEYATARRLLATGADVAIEAAPEGGLRLAPGPDLQRDLANLRAGIQSATLSARSVGGEFTKPVRPALASFGTEWRLVRAQLAATAHAVANEPTIDADVRERERYISDAFELTQANDPADVTRLPVIVVGNVRYLVVPPKAPRPGVLVAWRPVERPLQPDEAIAIVAKDTHADGVFLHPGKVLSVGSLSVTVEAVAPSLRPSVLAPRRPDEKCTEKQTAAECADVEQRYKRRLLAEALGASRAVSFEWSGGKDRWEARFGVRDGKLELLALNGVPGLDALTDRVTKSLGEAVKKKLPNVPEAALAHLIQTYRPVVLPVAIDNLRDKNKPWHLTIALAADGRPAAGDALVPLDEPNGHIRLQFDADKLVALADTFTKEYSQAVRDLGRHFRFLKAAELQAGKAVVTLLDGLDVTLPAPQLVADAGKLEIRLDGTLKGAGNVPDVFGKVVGWSLPGADALQVRTVFENKAGAAARSLALRVAFRPPELPSRLPPLEVTCQLPGDLADVREAVKEAVRGAAVRYLREWLADLSGTGLPRELEALKVGADGRSVSGAFALPSPFGAIPLQVAGAVVTKAGKLSLDVRATIPRKELERLLRIIGTKLGRDLNEFPVSLEFQNGAAKVRIEKVTVGGKPLPVELILTADGKLQLAPATVAALAAQLDFLEEWRKKFENLVASTIPKLDGVPKVELVPAKDDKTRIRVVKKGAKDEVLGEIKLEVTLEGIKEIDAKALAGVLVKLGAAAVTGALPEQFEVNLLGLIQAKATKQNGESYLLTGTVAIDGQNETFPVGTVRYNPTRKVIDFESLRLDRAAFPVLERLLKKHAKDFQLPDVGIQFFGVAPAADPVSGLGVTASVRLLPEFFDKLGLGALVHDKKIPVEGLTLPKAVAVRYDGSRLVASFDGGAIESVVGSMLQEELQKHFPIEVFGRKLSVKSAGYRAGALSLGVEVVEEGDFPVTLTGRLVLRLDGPPSWELSAGASLAASVKNWLLKYIPNTPFFTVDALDVLPDEGGKDFKVRFSFSSELYLMSLKSPVIEVYRGRVRLDANSRIGFGCALQIPLGSSPFFLVNPSGTLDLNTKDITIGAKMTVAGMGVENLIAVDGRLGTNLARPTYLEIVGRLVVLNFSLASAQARLDFAARNFNCQVRIGARQVVALEGDAEIQLPGGPKPWLLYSDMSAHVLGLEVARASVRADPTGFRARTKADFLVVKANVGFETDLKLTNPALEIGCSIDLGIAGAEVSVTASLQRIHVYVSAHATLIEVVVEFDVPTWAILTPPYLAAKIAEALVPKGIEIVGNPLEGLLPPKVPKIRLGGKIKIGGKGGDSKKGGGESKPGSPGAPGGKAAAATQAAKQAARGNPANPQRAATQAKEAVKQAAAARDQAMNAPAPGAAAPQTPQERVSQAAQRAEQLYQSTEDAAAAARAMKELAEFLKQNPGPDPGAAKQMAEEAEKLAKELGELAAKGKEELIKATKEKYAAADAVGESGSEPAKAPDVSPNPQLPPPSPAAPTAAPGSTGPVTPDALQQGAAAAGRVGLTIADGPPGENTLAIAGHVLRTCYAREGRHRSEAVRGFLRSSEGKQFWKFVGTRLHAEKQQLGGEVVVKFNPTAQVYHHALVLLALSEVRDALRRDGVDEVALVDGAGESEFKAELAPLAKSWEQATGRRSLTYEDLTYAMARTLVMIQNNDGSWGYAAWPPTPTGSGDMSLVQAALIALRTTLVGPSGTVTGATVERVCGPGAAGWKRLAVVFQKVRGYADRCQAGERFRYAPHHTGQINFVGGALLAWAPLPINLREFQGADDEAKVAALKECLGPDFGAAKAAGLFQIALKTRPELESMCASGSGSFLFHYQALYTVRGLRATEQGVRFAAPDGATKGAELAAQLRAFEEPLTTRYVEMCKADFPGVNYSGITDNGRKAIGLLTLSYLARDLGRE